MFPLRGAENDIQNHLLFFIFLGQGPPAADVVGGFCFVLFGFMGAAFGVPPPCGASLVLTSYCFYVFLSETQKEPKRSPLLPIAREARLKSASSHCVRSVATRRRPRS